jgi:hypothetical protein
MIVNIFKPKQRWFLRLQSTKITFQILIMFHIFPNRGCSPLPRGNRKKSNLIFEIIIIIVLIYIMI